MMATLSRRWICSALLTACAVSAAPSFGQDAAPAIKPPPVVLKGAPIPLSPEFTSPDIKPTLKDWLFAKPVALAKKLKITDPLQRPPFAAAPTDSLKGMAAGIRAVQLDAPNRVKAAAYLGTVDCATYPQAQDMLIATMFEDPQEEVRYEAVMALRTMLTRGCSNMNTECECESCANKKQIARESEKHAKQGQKALIAEAKGPAKKAAREARRENEVQEERYDCCRGCCNAKVLNALSKVAYDKTEACCWLEPSERVRLAAKEGLCLCCTVPGWNLNSAEPPKAPPTEPEKLPMETPAPNEKEVNPPQTEEAVPQLQSPPGDAPSGNPGPITQVLAARSQLSGTPSRPAVPGLKGFCIVKIHDRKFVPAKAEFSGIFDGRTYYFSSAEAQAEFTAAPEQFALAYRGFDPVVWQTQKELVDGQFLREFEGQFYMFTTKENWEAFKAAPKKFVLRKPAAKQQNVVSR